jgi:hypothetical protein
MSMSFNPFSRHVTAQVQPNAAATAVDSKPVEENPPAKPAHTNRNPFAGYESKKQWKLVRREEPPPAQKLLNFLQHDWPHEIVRLRDLTNYGPSSLRDRKKLIELAYVLVGHGWLVPIEACPRNTYWWRIVRGPSGYPTRVDVAINAATVAKTTHSPA